MNDSKELFSQEAETAVLSLLIQNPSYIYNLSGLKSFMFSSAPNRLIFSTMEELISQNLVPELNLIDSFSKSKGRDAQIGGRDYLIYLAKQSYTTDNLREFERQVMEAYKARILISLASSITPSIIEKRDVDSVMSQIRSTLDSLSTSSGGDTTSQLEDVLRESWKDLEERVKNPGLRGVSTGIHNLDLVTGGIADGDVWYIAGRPGMGKTAHMCNMMLNQAKAGIPVLMFSYEMPKKTLAERLISLETGINSFNIRLGTLDKKQMQAISDAIVRIKALPIFIDSNFNGNLNYVIATARKYVRGDSVKVCYLDYIQLLAERNAESTNELGRISRGLKLLANELGVGWVVGSQFNRLLETREDKRPQLSDLRQSGNLEEDADLVLGLFRPVIYDRDTKDKKLMEDIILKHRSGPRGMLPLEFDDETGRIT